MFLHHYNCIINVFTAQKSLSLDFLIDPLLRAALRGFLIREISLLTDSFFRARFITGDVYALLTGISNITACCSQGGLNGRVILTARVTLLFSFRPIHERKRAAGCARSWNERKKRWRISAFAFLIGASLTFHRNRHIVCAGVFRSEITGSINIFVRRAADERHR